MKQCPLCDNHGVGRFCRTRYLCDQLQQNKRMNQTFVTVKEGSTMNRLEILRVERERIIMTLGKENKNRVKLLTMLMDVDDEIEEILASELKSWSLGLVNNQQLST